MQQADRMYETGQYPRGISATAEPEQKDAVRLLILAIRPVSVVVICDQEPVGLLDVFIQPPTCCQPPNLAGFAQIVGPGIRGSECANAGIVEHNLPIAFLQGAVKPQDVASVFCNFVRRTVT